MDGFAFSYRRCRGIELRNRMTQSVTRRRPIKRRFLRLIMPISSHELLLCARSISALVGAFNICIVELLAESNRLLMILTAICHTEDNRIAVEHRPSYKFGLPLRPLVRDMPVKRIMRFITRTRVARTVLRRTVPRQPWKDRNKGHRLRSRNGRKS